MTIGSPTDIGLIIVSFLGVMLIGLTNLFVSFTLTIIVALRAQRPLRSMETTRKITSPA